MDENEQFDLHLRFVRGETSDAETESVEQQLRTHPELYARLLRIAEGEVLLSDWARRAMSAKHGESANHDDSPVAGIATARSRSTAARGRGDWRWAWSWAATAALLLVPPLGLALTIAWQGDDGLGRTAWAAQLHLSMERAAGVLGSIGLGGWLALRHVGLWSQPTWTAFGGAVSLASSLLIAQAAVDQRASADQTRLAKLFQNETWVSYDSAYYWPADLEELTGHPPQAPTDEEMLAELKTLRAAGFTAVYLHEMRDSQRNAPRLAREAGFRGVVAAIQITKPDDLNAADTRAQVENAVAASRHLDALCFGEVTAREVELEDLKRHLAELRRRTKKPVTTSFLDDEYFDRRGDKLRALADFSIRGLHHAWNVEPGVDAALGRVRDGLRSFHQDDLPSLLTFVGFPSGGGEAWTPDTQTTFFRTVHGLRKPQGTNVVYFTSFERPWARRYSELKKQNPYEGYFGLFAATSRDGERKVTLSPKPALEVFAPPARP